MPILNVFLIIGIASLVYSFFIENPNKKSAIWGGAILGVIVGIIVGIIKRDFSDILRAALIGADVGLVLELLSLISDRIRARR